MTVVGPVVAQAWRILHVAAKTREANTRLKIAEGMGLVRRSKDCMMVCFMRV